MTDTRPPALAAAFAQHARDERAAYVDSLIAARAAEWIAAGGCRGCRGTGYVCTWSTLDGWGYNEWGTCAGLVTDERDGQARHARPGETAETPCTATTVGPMPGLVLAYSTSDCRIPGTRLPIPPLAQSPAEVAHLAMLTENLEMGEEQAKAEAARWEMVPGARVEVTKGRKLAKGTRGVIVWAGEVADRPRWSGSWRDIRPKTRIGVRPDGANDVVYIDGANAIVIEPSVAHVRMLDLGIWQGMRGSEKQVAWAKRIRADLIVAGLVTDEELKDHCDARWWIDNRGRLPVKAA